jgi:hypothetical protein
MGDFLTDGEGVHDAPVFAGTPPPRIGAGRR